VIVPEGGGRWLEYAGGYSDMLAQRGADLTRPGAKEAAKEATKAAPPKTAKSSGADAEKPPPAKRRLAFKEKHALETLPKTIASLQAQMEDLQAKLDDPGFYARDRAGFDEVTAALGELQQKITTAEEQWLELEILREELAGG
jgi:ATP-binding cassette subfamily F protein uup